MRPYRIASLLALAGLLGLSHALRADEKVDNAEIARLQQSGELLKPEQILERVRATQAGNVTEVELKRKKGKYAYEVDVVDNAGAKQELTFDAQTGALLAREADDTDDDDADKNDKKDKKDDDDDEEDN